MVSPPIYLEELKQLSQNETFRKMCAENLLRKYWSESEDYFCYVNKKTNDKTTQISCVLGQFRRGFSMYSSFFRVPDSPRCGIEILGYKPHGGFLLSYRRRGFTVADLRAACKMNGIKIPSRTRKLGLISLLMRV